MLEAGKIRSIGASNLDANQLAAALKVARDENPKRVAHEAPEPDFVGAPSLTLPMLARLQDFPDDWVFTGPRLSQFRQIANAFPPRLSRAMGLALQRALSGEEIDLKIALNSPLFKKLDLWELRRHEFEDAAE